MDKVIVPSETFQKVVNVLAGLPYGQVAPLLAELEQGSEVVSEETKEE